jgi:hypothetical protein
MNEEALNVSLRKFPLDQIHQRSSHLADFRFRPGIGIVDVRTGLVHRLDPVAAVAPLLRAS